MSVNDLGLKLSNDSFDNLDDVNEWDRVESLILEMAKDDITATHHACRKRTAPADR